MLDVTMPGRPAWFLVGEWRVRGILIDYLRLTICYFGNEGELAEASLCFAKGWHSFWDKYVQEQE